MPFFRFMGAALLIALVVATPCVFGVAGTVAVTVVIAMLLIVLLIALQRQPAIHRHGAGRTSDRADHGCNTDPT
jgi:hypothetical protein